MKLLTLPAGWLTGLSIAAVLAVGLAGFRGITVARLGAHEEAERAFRDETAARARAVETRLTGIRSDLAFLAASSPVGRLGESAGPQDGRRVGAEAALLLFLRGHPEVVGVVVRSSGGEPLVHTGRRGGVPVLWVSSSPTGLEGAAVAPGRVRLTASFSFGGEPGTAAPTLETEVDPASLLAPGEGSQAGLPCRLRDAAGGLLARHSAGERPLASERSVKAEAEVAADGWSAPGPWRLLCEQAEGQAVGRVEEVAARYRTTLSLNLAAMGLAVVLGALAVQQARRRERLEAQAHEEARVRELERQLFHAERLTTVGRLAAGIAHEINNPLEGMSNWLSLARSELQRGRTVEAAEHLARVKEGLDRAAGIVRQVLAQSDPAKAPRVPVDLNQVLRETGEFVRSRKEFDAITFTLNLAEGPLLVRGSPVMLGQVAVNLILNACEAQPSGGEVRVISRREGAHAVAEIVDRGPGVAEDNRQRIFEPFFSTKDSTGLGLAVCHSIVRQHEGELSVTEREGGGALFRMTLPALEAS
ncbi:MAG: sensor histidine kinase [Solirubrobacterales bacterium]|jgi:signal transduction histidine kinase